MIALSISPAKINSGGPVRFNQAGFDAVFHDWNGPVGRHISRGARKLEMLAVSSAGLRTGALRRSIGTYYTRRGKILEARVGANPGPGGVVGYALYHHEGTRPHIIRPKKAQALRFTVAGHTVFAKVVHHPGTKPNPYLTRWIRGVFS